MMFIKKHSFFSRICKLNKHTQKFFSWVLTVCVCVVIITFGHFTKVDVSDKLRVFLWCGTSATIVIFSYKDSDSVKVWDFYSYKKIFSEKFKNFRTTTIILLSLTGIFICEGNWRHILSLFLYVLLQTFAFKRQTS